jgi:serine/threonine protein kinase
MMKRIQSPNGIFKSLHVEGTAGYCSPESYLKRHYSAQSDVWQAGCCLYSMLSGNAPFPQDNPERIMAALYAPMVGVGWERISELAKDLISRILVKDPSQRFTLEDILNHSWLQPGQAPEVKLDDGYRTRIYKLALRGRLKMLFLDEGLQTMCKRRRELLIQTLPFLQQHQSSSVGLSSSSSPSTSPGLQQRIISSDEAKKSSSSNELEFSTSRPLQTSLTPLPPPSSSSPSSTTTSLPPGPPSDRFIQQKLRYLKSGLFHAPSPLIGHSSSNTLSDITETHPVRRTSSYNAPPSSPSSLNRGCDGGRGQEKDTNLISAADVLRRTSDSSIILTPQSTSSSWKNINLSRITFQDFVIILNKVDLPQLATLPVFHIFEKDAGSGIMDMKEFLLTILTIYPQSKSLLLTLPSPHRPSSDSSLFRDAIAWASPHQCQ